MGNEFNQSLQGLVMPTSLESLSFGESFDQSLEGLDFPRLRSLSFGYQLLDSKGSHFSRLRFNQSLHGLIFPELESLSVGEDFNQSLQGLQMPHLTTLNLPPWSQPLIPSDLELPSLQTLSGGGLCVSCAEGKKRA